MIGVPSDFSDPFWKCAQIIETLEGGYAHDPADHGGDTMEGITQVTYDKWRDALGLPHAPVRGISDDDVNAIYYNWYWLGNGCDQLAWPLSLVHFDAVVNMSPYWWKQCLLAARGEWKTYLERRRWCYQQIAAKDATQAKFLPIWLKRCDTIYGDAEAT